MTPILFTALYLYAFWFVYIGVMGIYRAHLDGRLVGFTKWLAYPAVAVGVLMDVAANIVLATLIFVELPEEWLVTQRLTRYSNGTNGWRKSTAVWVCSNLLDVFDPTGKHCK